MNEARTKFANFQEFYAFYLQEHHHPKCRLLHFLGTNAALFFLLVFVITQFQVIFLILALCSGYAFSWLGHFLYEKNRPATFKHPLYSLLADFVMFKDIMCGKVKLK